MMENDFTGNLNSDCEKPMCHATDCETHHADCTCDSCCQLTDSVCEDNRDQCEETLRPSGGTKMKNKLMPMLANCAVLLAVITISGLVTNAKEFDRSLQTSAVQVEQRITDVRGAEVINNAEIPFGILATKNKLPRDIDPPDHT